MIELKMSMLIKTMLMVSISSNLIKLLFCHAGIVHKQVLRKSSCYDVTVKCQTIFLPFSPLLCGDEYLASAVNRDQKQRF